MKWNIGWFGAGDNILVTGAYTQNAVWYSGLPDGMWGENGQVRSFPITPSRQPGAVERCVRPGSATPRWGGVLFLDASKAPPTPDETFIWVATKTDLRWARIDLGTAALKKEVKALRCGLDARGAWTDES